VVVGFDWPAATSALNYLEDRMDAKTTAFRLVSEGIANFARMQRSDCYLNLDSLAHSTGASVVREAFDDADDRPGVAQQCWSVRQVMLLSGDVSAGGMAEGASKSSSLYRHCVRLTNYSNPFDNVLSLSDIERIGVAPRVRRVGLPVLRPGKAVEVNCGAHFEANKAGYAGLAYPAHTFWFHDAVVLEDILHTIRGAVDRAEIVTRVAGAQGLVLRRPV